MKNFGIPDLPTDQLKVTQEQMLKTLAIEILIKDISKITQKI